MLDSDQYICTGMRCQMPEPEKIVHTHHASSVDLNWLIIFLLAFANLTPFLSRGFLARVLVIVSRSGQLIRGKSSARLRSVICKYSGVEMCSDRYRWASSTSVRKRGSSMRAECTRDKGFQVACCAYDNILTQAHAYIVRLSYPHETPSIHGD